MIKTLLILKNFISYLEVDVMRFRLRSAIAIMLLFAISACKKEEMQKKEAIAVDNIKAAIPTFQFDWETADFMPSSPGTTPVLVPWASGSTQLFNDEIAFDFKKSDGWSLVYNTFSPTQVTSPNFFALYNRFRGILRFYLYIPPGNPNASSYFSDGLATSGLFNSVLMNYSNDVSDLANPITSTSRIQNYQIQSTGAWYASQYEIAYDPNLGNANQQNLNFVWHTASTNVTNVILNGQSNGTLTGTVGIESPGGFNVGTLLGQGLRGVLYATGLKAVSALKIKDKNIGTSIENGVKGGLTGAVSGFFNAIFGGSPTSPQLVNLTMNAQMSLAGTLSNNSGIASPTLAIPGTQINSEFIGYIPAYGNALGVLYMNEKPKIRLEEDSAYYSNNYVLTIPNIISNQPGPFMKYHKRFFSNYNNKGKIIFNPALINEGVTFQILKEDIIIPCDSMIINRIGSTHENFKPIVQLWGFEYEPDSHSGVDARMEIIEGQYYAVFSSRDPQTTPVADLNSWVMADNFYLPVFKDNIRGNDVFIRYTILVTPPNGGKPITIVKSFKPDIIN